MSRSPDRVAWLVLLGAFATFCALVIGVPTAIIAYTNNATVQPGMLVKLQAGKLISFGPTEPESDGRVVGLDGRALEEGSTVVLDNDGQSQASLTVSLKDSGQDAKINLYSGARLRISRARLPRYASSSRAPELVLTLQSGRIQVQNPDNSDTPIIVNTNQLTTTLRSGVFSIDILADGAATETNVSVREGSATVSLAHPESNKENVVHLLSNQRVAARGNASRLEVSQPYRNLIRNGDWLAPLTQDWIDISQLENDGDPFGVITVTEHSLVLYRTGPNLHWGRTGLAQLISDAVEGRRALVLRLSFSILDQDVPVCGGQGSECPLLVKIVYRAPDSGEHEWVQGFYAKGVPDGDNFPDYVRSVPPDVRQKHVKKTAGSRETWESGNLLTIIKDLQTLKSVSIYAEGHGVSTLVHSAELLLLD